ncbi:Cap15 family cyclic dinucleotide receptor domain-containing protein [Prevotella koreensis]
MKEYKLNLKVLVISIAIFSIIAIGIFLIINKGYSLEDVFSLLLHYGAVTVPLSFILYYFKKLGWRSNFWKWAAKIIHFPPDLRGRWEGKLDRIGENNPHDFVIEIKQTMTELKVCTYSESGMSESLIDTIASDNMEDDFTLCYLWEGHGGLLPGQTVENGKFKGFTMLKLIIHNQEKKLVGEYFTNRKPTQTKGKIDVTWKQQELLKQFKNEKSIY